MLLGSTFGQRLEPVRDVCHAMFHRPRLHAVSHLVGNGTVERMTVVDAVNQCLIGVRAQILAHLLAVEY